ncbi:MAG: ComEC/Rec2 family competence protein [Chitinophagaceae bacterium]
MSLPFIPFWRKYPFLRILVAFITGIILQWYLQVRVDFWSTILIISLLAFLALFFLPMFSRFRLGWIQGLCVNAIFISVAAIVTWQQDIRNDTNWAGHLLADSSTIILTIQEPLIEKGNSYKAIASVNYLQQRSSFVPATGNVILYFKKDSAAAGLKYGSQIIIKEHLQPIKNSGNPGSFDYKRYCLFQGITHQVFLEANEFFILPDKNSLPHIKLLYVIREKVIDILRLYIKGDKELGLAEALLIGYKDDLDKSLVQAYTNTGVVHIIAISGLHLSLIYGLLILIMRPVQKIKRLKWIRAFIIISALLLFSLIAGGQASVMRSAVMFIAFVIAETLDKKSSLINTMAVSAFLLLCYNPFWLWDVGFQLSYAAVLGIVIFFQPVYNLVVVKNKILDAIWKLNAVTLSAQIITLPFTLYYFHQFPVYFLLTNLLAVPLSSIILLGEILLCVVVFIPVLASFVGELLGSLLTGMNNYVERINSLPFAVWDSMQVTFLQAILVLFVIWCFYNWLIDKKTKAVFSGLLYLLVFFSLRAYSFIDAKNQNKVIVYNVAKHSAIDIVNGRKYYFVGDSDLLYDGFLKNFNLKPSRILHRISTAGFSDSEERGKLIQFADKRILLIAETVNFKKEQQRHTIDVLIISKSPSLYLNILLQTFDIKCVVADASTSLRKRKYWKKDCETLHIPFHDVSEEGAFILSLY